MGAFIIILLIFLFFVIEPLLFFLCLSSQDSGLSFLFFVFLGVIPPVRNRGGCGKLVALGVRLMMGRVVDFSTRCFAERGSEMQTL